MSLDVLKKEILRFVGTDTPEVMVINGKWGVGKTYSWDTILLEANRNNNVSLKKYSYVSLFGINSLDSFRYTIFENVINTKLIGSEPSFETLNENWTSIASSFSRKHSKILSKLPVIKNYFPTVESLSFLSLKNTLICVDDFERKGAKLEAKEIMGVLSELKERKKCKVVLILNDESFSDESFKKEYDNYKEKVVDIEIRYDPSSSKCVKDALNNDSSEFQQLNKFITQLNINNIRIMKKVERLATMFAERLSKYEQGVLEQALCTLVLYTWCYYQKGDDTPTLDYLKNIGYKLYGGIGSEQSDQEKVWNTLLTNYGYESTDEFDLVISECVENGFIHEEKFIEEAEKCNQRFVALRESSEFNDVWSMYHDNFHDNEDDIVKGLLESFERYSSVISPINLNGSVKLLRELGKNDEADQIIKDYIKSRKSERKLFDLADYPFAGDIDDPKLMKEFSRAYDELTTYKSASEVLANITENKTWDDDITSLARTTVAEYIDLFKNENGSHINKWIKTCLNFGRNHTSSPNYSIITDNVTTALQSIGSESTINARRISKFGINAKAGD